MKSCNNELNMGKSAEVIEDIHEHIQIFASRVGSSNDNTDYLLANRLLSVICRNRDSDLSEYARIMNNLYGLELDRNDISRLLRFLQIDRQKERRILFEWADSVAEFYAKAFIGSREDFDKLEEQRKNVPLRYLKHQGIQERTAAIMIYEKMPNINRYNDRETLFKLGNVLAKNYFYIMYDALCRVYEFPLFKPENKKIASKRTVKKISYEQALSKIESLEIELERTNSMLGELQNEFNSQLQESKIAELTSFFAHLNSDKYGNILDQLLQVRKGIEQLKKENYELPLEINGLFIMIKQLIQFTRDSHIDPIMKLHAKKEVSAKEIEFCDYEGEPFKSDTDRKIVEVISPGWVYKDHNVQISRPRVREV